MSEGELHKQIREKWIATGISIQELEDILATLRKEFPTIQMAEERFKILPKEARALYSVARAYYDLTQEWLKKWLSNP